jgi:predicted MFS family arabinose efflux permease
VGGAAAFVVVAALAVYAGLVNVTATQVSDAAGVFLLLVVVGFFGTIGNIAGSKSTERPFSDLALISPLLSADYAASWMEWKSSPHCMSAWMERACP